MNRKEAVSAVKEHFSELVQYLHEHDAQTKLVRIFLANKQSPV